MLGSREPCPCGSGRRFGKCCGSADFLEEMWRATAGRRIERAQAERKYGKVREVIQADFKGSKVVAVGNGLFFSSTARPWKTFPDFLESFLRFKMGRCWWEDELKKPPEQQHPLTHLAKSCFEARSRQPATPAGVVEVRDDGASTEYGLVGYDLYVVNHHQLFSRRILDRLRERDQYHGARIELAAVATMLRAGFQLEMENEKDGSKKHPEFLAIDPVSKIRVAVEAKRRHRLPHDTGTRLGIRNLVSSAAQKVGNEAFVLYLELNAPPPTGPEMISGWADEINRALDECARVEDQASPTGYRDLFSATMVTNRVFGAGRSPAFAQLLFVPNHAARPLPQHTIDALRFALAQTMNVPQCLPPQGPLEHV